jgi:ribonuclease HI
MTAPAPPPLQLWTAGDCAGPPGYGYGGWAWLAAGGAETRGFVGGERHTTTPRMRLRAVVEALKAVADRAAAPLQLDLAEAPLARLAADLPASQAAGWRDAQGEAMADADLWAEVARLAAARLGPVRFTAGARLGAADAGGFVAEWAAFARDRCKAKGAFTSAIPKPNLSTLISRRGPA